ncbi:hypothetical protein SCHPADRAFT_598203 [Schizopora paradoxa]|uniref:Uncharacterized protein n=1 Tax=Schizopora paradoxa TaxID=27342 RepID=A0A0H2RBC3_9AGAM|nr:hypothetical protein SCHPADRAFT_598203 [Schizopora paradoxa]
MGLASPSLSISSAPPGFDPAVRPRYRDTQGVLLLSTTSPASAAATITIIAVSIHHSSSSIGRRTRRERGRDEGREGDLRVGLTSEFRADSSVRSSSRREGEEDSREEGKEDWAIGREGGSRDDARMVLL